MGYYNSVAGSYGLQAGAQSFGYVLFLMTNSAVNYLNRSGGWEIGVGPSIVVVDEGIAHTLTTTTLKSDVYAFVFDQKGLMAGMGLQGSKITKIKSERLGMAQKQTAQSAPSTLDSFDVNSLKLYGDLLWA